MAELWGVLCEEGEPPLRASDNPGFLLRSEHTLALALDGGSRLAPAAVWRNAPPAELVEHALRFEPGTHLTSSGGALAVSSGAKTGRSPRDKRVVREPGFAVWWGAGSPNQEMDQRTFLAHRELAVQWINLQHRVYVVDGLAGWDAQCRVKVRVLTCSAHHALIMTNMLIRPSAEELASYGEPDFVIYHCGAFPANKFECYASSSTAISVCLSRKEMVLLGTSYGGEMKKGVWTLMHYHLPQADVLFLHSGCNVGAAGDVTLFLGLSGTGKTALSSDPRRPLIGDDEHCWSRHGVFNIEGGCYAKVGRLTPDSEPGLWAAIKFGAVLENAVFDPDSRVVDFQDL